MLDKEMLKRIGQNDANLTELILKNVIFEENDINELYNALANNTVIKNIAIEDSNIDDNQIALLCKGIKKSRTPIIDFKLKNNSKITYQSDIVILDMLNEKISQYKAAGIEDIRFDKLQETVARTPDTKDKDIVLVVGETGAGKTTIVDYLIGCKMKRDTYKEKPVVVVDKTSQNHGVIGHTSNSETEYPQTFKHKDFPFYYCDCPGFEDTKGKESRAQAAISMKKAIASARSIGGVIIIIDCNLLLADPRALTFSKLLEIVGNMFFNPFSIIDTNNVFFVFNKVPSGKTKDDVRISIVNILEDKKNFLTESGNRDAKLKNEINMIEMVLSHESQIYTVDPLDNGNSSLEINQLFKGNKNILPEDFKYMEESRVQQQIKEYMENMVYISNHIINTLIDKSDEISKCEKEKSIKEVEHKKATDAISNLSQENNTSEEKLNKYIQWNNSRCKDISDEINRLNAEILTYQKGITECEGELKKLDTTEPVPYQTLKWSGATPITWQGRTRQGKNWLGETKWSAEVFTHYGAPLSHRFTYHGIPYHSVILESNKGSFSQKDDKPKEGLYSVTFQTLDSHADLCKATVKINVEKRNHPDNVKKITYEKNQKNSLEQKIITLTSKISTLNAETHKLVEEQQTMRINEVKAEEKRKVALESLNRTIKNLQTELTIIKEQLTILVPIKEAALKACQEQRSLFTAIIQIVNVLDFALPGSNIFHFIERFEKFQQLYPFASRPVINTSSPVAGIIATGAHTFFIPHAAKGSGVAVLTPQQPAVEQRLQHP